MKKALVVGGGSGIGLALTLKLLKKGYDKVYILGKDAPVVDEISEADRDLFVQNTIFCRIDFNSGDFSVLETINDIQALVITIGFGRVAPFEMLLEKEIDNLIRINFQAVVRIISNYYDKLLSNTPFYCAIMGSIAGHLTSPLFSVYGSAKAGLCSFIENINVELAHSNSINRVLEVSPGAIKGTNFYGKGNVLSQLDDLSESIINKMLNRELRYIPNYDEVYKNVLLRYKTDPIKFGLESYNYKIERISHKPQLVVGYLSGTFDLFHIGHLNLLKRAKEECDYLIVGVHKSGAWKGKETFIPFEERLEIVGSIKYVDKAVESFTEDIDAYAVYHYDKLFVGSDYKNTDRFNRYEEFFKNTNTKIVYFPYTQGTSSTELRKAIKQ